MNEAESADPATRPGMFRLACAAMRVILRSAPVGTAVALALTAIAGALPALSAWFVKLLIDELTRGSAANSAAVTGYAIAGAGTLAASTIAGEVLIALSRRNELRVHAYLESDLFDRVNRLIGLRYFDDPSYHDRLRLAQDGASGAPPATIDLITNLVRGMVGIATYVGVVAQLWPPLVVLILAVAGAALIAQAWLSRLHLHGAREISRNARLRTVFQFLLADPTAAKEIRLYGLGRFFHGRMMETVRRSGRAELAMTRRESTVQSGFAIVGGAVAAIGTLLVARRILRGAATVGDMAFLIAAVTALQTNLSGIIDAFGRATRSLRLFDAYLQIVDAPADLPAGTLPAPALRDKIEVRDVWFRYRDDGPWTLRGVSFTLQPGQSVGLVGLNGAGKSTLVKLLCRFFDPQRGAILWDGVDIREMDVDDLRSRISATYQDFMQFDLTAAECIGIGDLPHISSRPRVVDAARLADVDQALSDLPHGYDTMISSYIDDLADDGGVLLSGGQWQRVAVARALMRHRSELLILDEPSSGLDAIAEYRIHTMLRGRREGRATLMISHRLSSVRDADQILVLADGIVAEHGTHAELMAAAGRYAEMFTLQAAGYQPDSAGEPVATEPVATEPVASEPVASEPVASEPVAGVPQAVGVPR